MSIKESDPRDVKDSKKSNEKLIGWKCRSCKTFISGDGPNAIAQEHCFKCGVRRHLSWRCSKCTVVNENRFCTGCGNVNNEVELFEVKRNIDDTWNCPSCQKCNIASNEDCYYCHLHSREMNISVPTDASILDVTRINMDYLLSTTGKLSGVSNRYTRNQLDEVDS